MPYADNTTLYISDIPMEKVMQILEKVLKSYFNDSITTLSKQTLKKVFFNKQFWKNCYKY